jgi:hypothetical protein
MSRLIGHLVTATLVVVAGMPRTASAQQNDGWQFSVVPLYFWAANLDGRMAAGPVDVPVSLEFADAADHLAGAFSFHFEVARGGWAGFADLNFISLESSAPFVVGPLTVSGDLELDNTVFEAGAIYLVVPERRLGIIAGMRTYTLAPSIAFNGAGAGAAPVDTSETSVNAFGGVVFRPQITSKWTFVGRADLGGGEADLTWSAVAGLAYQYTSWGSLEFGFKALGIDQDGGDRDLREYDVTHYGPIVGLNVRWGQR